MEGHFTLAILVKLLVLLYIMYNFALQLFSRVSQKKWRRMKKKLKEGLNRKKGRNRGKATRKGRNGRYGKIRKETEAIMI